MRFFDPLRLVIILSTAVSFSALPACAGRVVPAPAPLSPPPSPPAVLSVPSEPSTPDVVYREIGLAGWYGREMQGKKTASGEVFDMHALTAAHRTLPFGTSVRVTNLDNYKSINVKINDRGPFVNDWVLKLSYGAARKLGFVHQGTARVKIETLEDVADAGTYTVQAANFTERENALFLKERLSKKYVLITIVPVDTNVARFYSVRVGSYSSEERAEAIASKLTHEGLEPLVIRKD